MHVSSRESTAGVQSGGLGPDRPEQDRSMEADHVLFRSEEGGLPTVPLASLQTFLRRVSSDVADVAICLRLKQLCLRITASLRLGSVPVSVELQPGVEASENRDPRRGPKRADRLQESTAVSMFATPNIESYYGGRA
eukprot:630228-Alexandrium_andersonii.AAC.5